METTEKYCLIVTWTRDSGGGYGMSVWVYLYVKICIAPGLGLKSFVEVYNSGYLREIVYILSVSWFQTSAPYSLIFIFGAYTTNNAENEIGFHRHLHKCITE